MADNAAIMRGDGELQRRADMALSTLTSGGLLAPEVFDKFLEVVQEATPIVKGCQQIKMKSWETLIPKIIFTGRLLHATPGDNTPVTSGNRFAPTTDQVTLSSQEYVGQVNIPDRVLEDNVEKEKLETRILSMVAKRVAIDVETFGLQGDTTSGDADLALQDGWIKMISDNVVAGGGVPLTASLMRSAILAVDLKYRQAAEAAGDKHLFYVEDHAGQTWYDAVAARGTPGGDEYILKGGIPPYSGFNLVKSAQLPVASSQSTALFTPKSNLIYGIWKDLRIEPWRDAPNRRWVLMVTVRIAFAVEQQDAACKITGINAT